MINTGIDTLIFQITEKCLKKINGPENSLRAFDSLS